MSAPDAAAVLAAHVEKRAKLERAAHEASWQLAATGEERWEKEAAEHESAIRRLLSDRDTFRLLATHRDTAQDPDLRRQVEVAWLDFAAWLKTLSAKNRKIVHELALGERPGDVARKFDVSHSRVSQIRRELQRSWEEFVGDEKPAARA